MFRYQESIEIAAPPDLIYDIVADVTSTGERSPECRRVEWFGEPTARSRTSKTRLSGQRLRRMERSCDEWRR